MQNFDHNRGCHRTQTTTAHSLKSSSANLGAISFSKLCQQLEDSSREDRVEAASEQLLAIEALLSKVLLELRQQVEMDEDSDSDSGNCETIHSPQVASAPSVLVVDDDTGFRLTTSETLRGTGLNVIEASSGEDALSMLEDNLPDLILLDAIMPSMDGFEVCRQIRKRRETRAIPVMMLTGLGDMESVNRAFESGAADFLNDDKHTQTIAPLRQGKA